VYKFIDQNQNWKKVLNNLAHVWRIAQHSSLFPRLDWGTQIKEIQAKIRKNLEIPQEWFSGCKQLQGASFSSKVKGSFAFDVVTDEEKIVVCGITLFLAKTLLVYERLNAFYM
jgi:hypothetical protein